MPAYLSPAKRVGIVRHEDRMRYDDVLKAVFDAFSELWHAREEQRKLAEAERESLYRAKDVTADLGNEVDMFGSSSAALTAWQEDYDPDAEELARLFPDFAAAFPTRAEFDSCSDGSDAEEAGLGELTLPQDCLLVTQTVC